MTSAEPRLVVDASALFQSFTATSDLASWLRDQMHGVTLCAPSLMVYEVLNTIRRHVLSKDLTAVGGERAVDALEALVFEEVPATSILRRAWQLRPAVTMYDAAYVAAAELLDAPLLTLDTRLMRAPGPRCKFLVYEPA